MELFNWYLIIGASFFGLVFGSLLSFVAYSELRVGRIYLLILEKILLLLLVIVLVYPAWHNLVYLANGFLVGFVVSIFTKKLYFYLGLALFFSFSLTQDFLFIVASLIFLIGLPYGSRIDTFPDKILTFKVLFFNLAFFMMPFLLVFISESVILYKELFLGFAAGALLYENAARYS